MKKRLLPLLFFLAFGVITYAQNVTIDIQESENGCSLSTDCENNVACFDLIITINQPNWQLASYNIWTQYPKPATMSYANDNACITQNGGDTDDDFNGQYRVAGINGVTLLQPNVPTIFHTICYDYLDEDIIRDSVIAVGGKLSVYGFPFSTTVTLSHTITGATAGLTINTQEFLNINSNTLSCLVPDLLIEKELTSYADNDGSGTISFGDVLTYTITTTNTGNITQTNVVVSDPKLNPASTTCVTLPVGAQCILTGTYTVTQTDVNAGKIVNTATVESDEAGPYEASITTLIGQQSDMTINKALLTNVAGGIAVGQSLVYKVEVTNTGNTTLHNVAVSDVKLTPSLTFCAEVLPGQKCTLTGAYLVKQADIDAGEIVNTANAISDETPPATTELTTPVPQYPTITTVKTLHTDVSGGIAVGDVLSYSVKVTNTGNTTLHNVTASDLMLTPNSSLCASVAPAGICTLTGMYVVQQADMDAGQIVNTGTGDSDQTDPVTSQVTITIVQEPAMTIAKTLDTDISAGVMAGDVLTYTVEITNTGNITLNNVVVADNKITPTSATCASVAPGAACSLTGSYTLTQADIDAGEIGNTGTGDSDETDPVTKDITTPLPQTPELTVVKSAAESNYTAIGQEIQYTILVTNTGNVTIDNIVITDANADAGSIACNGNSLLPGEFLTCTAIHTVDVDDVLAGEVVNIASATGDDPLGNPSTFESNEVVVSVKILIANDDDASGTPVNGYNGGIPVSNVLDNDLLNGDPVVPGEVTIGIISDPADGVTLNTTTGAVTVDPQTPAGTYYITYQICENLNLTNCDQALVTVVVEAAPIIANDDTYDSVDGYTGNANVGNALVNDLYNGSAASLDDVDITVLIPATPINGGPVPVLDPSTGIVSVPALTPAGVYTIDYNICEELNTGNCDPATITVTVNASADLAISKVGAPNPVLGGQVIVYTIAVENLGISDAQAVEVSDVVPATILAPEYSTDGGTTWNTWVSPYAYGTLAAGSNFSFQIRGALSSNIADGTIISNTATVSSATDDPVPGNNTSTYEATVNASADLVITKAGAPDPIVAGSTITYTLLVHNNGPSAALSVQVSDNVPASILNPTFSIDGGLTYNPWTSPLAIGNFGAGSSYTVLIKGQVDPAFAGSFIINSATVNSPTYDPNTSNNTSSASTAVTPSADLAITKEGTPDPVFAGQMINYTITVTNAGPNTAHVVTLTDAVPASISNVEYSINNGGLWQSWVSPFVDGSIAKGNSSVILIRGIVNSDVPAGTIISNTALVSSSTLDPNPANNSSTEQTAVNASADLAIVKTSSPNPVIAGNVFTYTLAVTNLGPSDAQNVSVSDNVQAEILNPEYNAGTGWNPWASPYSYGTLANGGSFSIQIRGTVSPEVLGADILSNTAAVSSTTPDPNDGNNSSTVTTVVNALADLSITKTSAPDPVLAGAELTYTITVTNNGPSVARSVKVADVVPGSILNPQISTDAGATWNPWLSPYNYTYGTLNSGSVFGIQIKGTVNPNVANSSIITNTASVSSITDDPDPSNNLATDLTTVNASADVSILKTGPATIIPGTQITYSLTVVNNGPSYSANVVISDVLPAGIINGEYSLNNGNSWNLWSGSRTLGSFSYPGSNSILIRGAVEASFTGTLENTASVTSDTYDPDLSNNASTVQTTAEPKADLAIIKKDLTAPVNIGSEIVYQITVQNNGSSDATDVLITDIIDINIISGVHYSTDLGNNWNPWTGSLNIGTLNNAASYVLLVKGIVVDASPNPNVDPIPNTATVSSPVLDPNPGNNSSTILTPLNEVVDLGIEKSGPVSVNAGQTIEYLLEVTNYNNTFTAHNVIISDNINSVYIINPLYTVDAGATWLPWTGSVNVGDVDPLAAVSIQISATVRAGATGSIPNTAHVTNDVPDSDPSNDNSSITTPIDVVADLEVEKTLVTPLDQFIAGQQIEYLLTYNNHGPSDATNVIISDIVPSMLTNVTASRCGANYVAWAGSFNAGTVVTGGGCTIRIRGTITSDYVGDITNLASIKSDDVTDPDPSNNTSEITNTVITKADLAVTKTGQPEPAIAGETFTYTITLTNLGPSDALNVNVEDNLPAGLTFVSAAPTLGSWTSPYWTIGALATGSTVSMVIVTTVNANVPQNTVLVNTATVTSTTPDPEPGNNSDTETTDVDNKADLGISKIGNPASILAGETLTYTIGVTNIGPSDAQNVNVNDVVPATLLSPQYSINGTDWNPLVNPFTYTYGTLANGGSFSFFIKGTVDPNTADGSIIVNEATVSSSTQDPNTANNKSTASTPVNELADVSIIKTCTTSPVIAGEPINYTLTVYNAGSSAAKNLTITDAVASSISDVEFSLDGTTWTPWINPFVNGTIAPLSTVVIYIKGNVNSNVIHGTTIINTAAVSSTTPDPDHTNNESTVETEVHASADLAIAKTVDDATPKVGDDVTFTITATNNGPSDATGVVATDNIPAGYTVVSVSPSGSTTWTAPTWTIGSLAKDASATLTVVATVNATGSYANTATITGDQEDPTPGNNTSTNTPVPISVIVANDDTYGPVNGYTGNANIGNALDNDSCNGVTPASLDDVDMTVLIPATPINGGSVPVLNTTTGIVSVPAGTPAGTYTIDYKICDELNTGNCDPATITVTVNAPVILANDDTGGPVNGATGGVSVPNVLVNDLLNGAPANPLEIALAQISTTNPGVTLDPLTGAVNVASGTPAGDYELVYEICEILNPANCDQATVSVPVTAPEILAVDDNGVSINGYVGGVSVPNVLVNDLLNGAPVNPLEIALAQISTTHPGVTLDPLTGAVNVAPGTPEGDYELVYEICEILNPANCDQATVFIPVTAPEILAVDDNGISINGYDGGVSVPNVLVNDLLNGTLVNPLEITLTQISTTNPGVTLDPLTGAVNVAPGTPAGNYELVYEICEILNPANCDQATVFIPVTAPEILAIDDTGTPVNGYNGGVSVPNVLVNDLLNSAPVSPLEISLAQISTTNPGVTLDPLTGAVNVAPGTPAGDYELVYEICEILNPANCDQATIFIPVTAPEILAVDDTGTPVNGYNGGVSVPNVLVNDLLNGAPVDPLEITLAQISTTNPGVTLDPLTGAVNVAPGTPAGDYELVYEICEILNPANCDQATAYVEVTFSTIVANDDNGTPVNGYVGSISVVNVLDNDQLDGNPIVPTEITLAQISTTHPGVMLDPITGNVRVAPGTPAGDYELVYEICEILNPTNCDQATAYIPVTAPEILAVDDNGVSINGYDGGVSVPNVLVNDLLNGALVNPLEIALTQISTTNPGVTLDPLTGAVNVASGTPAGDYELVYEICEILNPTNCDQATVFVPVTAPEILAVDDNGISINGYDGGVSVPNVLVNDLLNGALVNPLEIALTQISTTNPGVTLDPLTGAVNVAPGTPAGDYELVYEICEILNPINCDQATVFVPVTAPEILAVDDNGTPVNGYVGGGSVPNVLVNDLLNSLPVVQAEVALTQISTTNPGVTLDPLTGAVNVAPGTPAGDYELVYEICEILNATNCDQATVFVPVTAPEILAVDDNGVLINGVLGGVSVANVLANDLLNGVLVNPALITLTQISTTNPAVTLDPLTGAVNVAPGTPTGTYYIEYEICEILNPANCDQALVTVPVFQEPTVTFCINDEEAQSSGQYAYCSTEPVALALCGITSGVAPFDICYIINGTPDCVYDIALDDVIFSQLFAAGVYDVTILSITDDAGYSVVDLSSYHFQFTISVGATAFAGDNDAICQGSTYELLSAKAQNAGSVLWSGGDGVFTPSANVLNPIYTPGPQDISDGSVELCLTAQSELPCTLESVDCMTLTITAPPSADAGIDLVACQSDGFVMLNGVVNNAASAEWNSSGFEGFFADSDEPVTMYFFGDDDISNGGATLCLKANAIYPCSEAATDCVTLTIIADPTANAGPDAVICEGDNYLLSGASVTDAGDIEWETYGDGTFDNLTLLNPVYIPGPVDIANGTVQLCINAEAVQNCGTSAIDCMILTIAKLPQANPGGDLSLSCSDYDIPNGKWLPVELTNTITGDYDSILWTTDGDGTFSNSTAVAPFYYPGLADIWKGDIELCVTVQSVEACQTSDTRCMMLYIPQQLIYFDVDGWWGISSYLDTDLPLVKQVMDPLVLIPGSQHLVTMLDKQGKYFWAEPVPTQGTLGNWMPIGYKAKIKNPPACLPIYGDSLLNQTFTVSGAFTFLPVLTNVPVAINELLAGHLNDILLIYDWSKKVLWTPQAADFTELYPGRAYLMVNRAAIGAYTIEYPDFVPDAPHLYPATLPKAAVIHSSPWQQEINTAVPHIMLFDDKAMNKLSNGDILGVFDSQGNCHGQAEYGTEGVFSLIAMGHNDQLRDERAGFETGEKMFVRRYNATTGEQQAVTFVYNTDFPSSDGLFAANGASQVIDIIETATSVNDDLSVSHVTIYPNPANQVINIASGYDLRKVTLINYVGQTVFSQVVDGNDFQINVSGFVKGMYFVRIETTQGSVITKPISIQ